LIDAVLSQNGIYQLDNLLSADRSCLYQTGDRLKVAQGGFIQRGLQIFAMVFFFFSFFGMFTAVVFGTTAGV
jgi:hypothetical protein